MILVMINFMGHLAGCFNFLIACFTLSDIPPEWAMQKWSGISRAVGAMPGIWGPGGWDPISWWRRVGGSWGRRSLLLVSELVFFLGIVICVIWLVEPLFWIWKSGWDEYSHVGKPKKMFKTTNFNTSQMHPFQKPNKIHPHQNPEKFPGNGSHPPQPAAVEHRAVPLARATPGCLGSCWGKLLSAGFTPWNPWSSGHGKQIL